MILHNCQDILYWEGGMEVDADGAPNAYGPLGGLDYLQNAGGPTAKNPKARWYGVVVDPQGRPIVQGPTDPCPGYYVATTALQDPSKRVQDPRRYVNSCQVPYVSLPGDCRRYGVGLGDVALVWCRATGQASAAIVADIGPLGKWGEGSIALAKALGIPDSPKRGGADQGVVWIVFKASSLAPRWPRSNQDVALQVQELIDRFGGVERFAAAAMGPPLRSQS